MFQTTNQYCIMLYILLLKPMVFEDPPFQERHLKAARVDSNLIRLGYVTFRNGRMWETQAAINLPWLGMVNIPPIKMVMTWGQFIWFIDVYWVYHITQHSKLFQAQMLSEYRSSNLSGWIFCSPICGPIWAHFLPTNVFGQFCLSLGYGSWRLKKNPHLNPRMKWFLELRTRGLANASNIWKHVAGTQEFVEKQLTSGLPQYWVWITAFQVPF